MVKSRFLVWAAMISILAGGSLYASNNIPFGKEEQKESQETVDAKQLQLIDEYFDSFSFQEAEKLYWELFSDKQTKINNNYDNEISKGLLKSLEKLKRIMEITSKKDGPGTGLENPNVSSAGLAKLFWSRKDDMLDHLVLVMRYHPDNNRVHFPRYLSYLVQMPHGHTSSQKGKGDTLIVDQLSADEVAVMKRNLSALMESDGKNYTFDQDFIDLAEKLKKKRNTDWEEMSKNVAPKINKVAQRVQKAGDVPENKESQETIDAKQLQLIDEYFDSFSFQEAEKLYWELFSDKQTKINTNNDNEISKGLLKSLEKLKRIMDITSKKDGPGTGLENPNVSSPGLAKLFWGRKDDMLDHLVLVMRYHPDNNRVYLPRYLSYLVQMPHGHKLPRGHKFGDIKLSADEVAVMKRNLSALMESDGKNYTFDQDFIDLAEKLKKNKKIEKEDVSDNLFPEINKVAQQVQEAGDDLNNRSDKEIGHMNSVLSKGLDNPLVNQEEVQNYYQKIINYYQKIINVINPKNKKDRVNKRSDKDNTSSLKLRRGSSVVVSSPEVEAE